MFYDCRYRCFRIPERADLTGCFHACIMYDISMKSTSNISVIWKLALFGAIALLLVALYVGARQIGWLGQDPLFSYERMRVTIGGNEIIAWVANTPEKRTSGLMGVKELPPGTGMLFVFPEAAPRTFWNKNTLIDLDLLWVTGNVVSGVSALPREGTAGTVQVTSPLPANAVVEVPQGWAKDHNIQLGDGVRVFVDMKNP